MNNPVLDIKDLHVTFAKRHGGPEMRAVAGVSLQIGSGETVGLVGESGSGKTTLGNAVLGLVRVTDGAIRFCDEDITNVSARRWRSLAGQIQAVFQDPYRSLNPARTIGESIAEGIPSRLPGGAERAGKAVRARVFEALEQTGLPPGWYSRYPRELSGGQRQRVAIARAIVGSPKLIICDEITSALDLSVKAQILNLLSDLQEQLSLSFLFIAHDLPVVGHVSGRIVVMYKGRIVEEGTREQVYADPRHPYTQSLMFASPVPDPVLQRSRRAQRRSMTPGGTAPLVGMESKGEVEPCSFAQRCPFVASECLAEVPPLLEVAGGRKVACARIGEIPHRGEVQLLADKSC